MNQTLEKGFTLGDFLPIIRQANPTTTSNKSFIRTANKCTNKKSLLAIINLQKKFEPGKLFRKIESENFDHFQKTF